MPTSASTREPAHHGWEQAQTPQQIYFFHETKVKTKFKAKKLKKQSLKKQHPHKEIHLRRDGEKCPARPQDPQMVTHPGPENQDNCGGVRWVLSRTVSHVMPSGGSSIHLSPKAEWGRTEMGDWRTNYRLLTGTSEKGHLFIWGECTTSPASPHAWTLRLVPWLYDGVQYPFLFKEEKTGG